MWNERYAVDEYVSEEKKNQKVGKLGGRTLRSLLPSERGTFIAPSRLLWVCGVCLYKIFQIKNSQQRIEYVFVGA